MCAWLSRGGDRCEVALTARVCVRDPVLGWLDVGHFIHFTKPLTTTTATPHDSSSRGGGGEGGFELRSRFWLGDVAVPLK